MGVVVDTSVAVPLLVASHSVHRAVAEWASGQDLGLSGHARFETYSVLTRLPGDARVAPDDAVRLIDENFPLACALPADVELTLHRELASRRVAGGAVYDGLVAAAARENDRLLVTRDARARTVYEAIGARVEVWA